MADHPDPKVTKPRDEKKKKGRMAGMAAIALIVVAGAVGGWWWGVHENGDVRQPAVVSDAGVLDTSSNLAGGAGTTVPGGSETQ